MRSLLALALFTTANLARAQAAPPLEVAPAAAGAEPAPPGRPVEVELLPPAAPTLTGVSPASAFPSLPRAVLSAFQRQYLSVDEAGQASRGKAHEPLTTPEFYAAVGRPDLVEAYQSAQHARLGLQISGGLVAVSGVVLGVVELAGRPNLTAAPCDLDIDLYNDRCHPEYERRTDLGTALIVGGLAGGAILELLGYRLDPTPLAPYEAKQLATAHNAALWRELRGQSASTGAQRPISVAPVAGPHGGGLAIAARF